MATPTASRPGRTLLVLAALTALLFGGIWLASPDRLDKQQLTLADRFQPRLGLDLEGGTQVILTARVAPGTRGQITPDAMDQAVAIIRNRVDSFGVAEAEVVRSGARNIVISVPGKQGSNILSTVQQTAELRFRQVLMSGPGVPTPTQSPSPMPTPSASGSPTGTASPKPSATATKQSNQNRVVPQALRAASSPSPTPTPNGGAGNGKPPVTGFEAVTPQLQEEFAKLDCTNPETVRQQIRRTGADDPNKPLVTCDQNGAEKFILGPAEVLGKDVSNATADLGTNSQGFSSGEWVVNLSFNKEGTKKFADVTRRLFGETGDLNRFAIVLDGLSVSAPTTQAAIVNGQAQISGSFTQKSAQELANVLKFGALPLTFDPSDVQQVSATLGGDQLRAGIVAGLIGLALVVVYSLLYYRGLGLVTIASLVVAGVLNYAAVVFLGWQIGFRLSLAGVAGLIVAIGITADSFIVYFERLRDEVRDGRTLRVAVENGWVRARRTILAADFVSLLAAVVLYLLSVGGVRGFAFALGLTTLVDLAVVFLFTKPLVTLLARTRFFGGGHKLSGLDPVHLGSSRPLSAAKTRAQEA